jgi:hypothetical protein
VRRDEFELEEGPGTKKREHDKEQVKRISFGLLLTSQGHVSCMILIGTVIHPFLNGISSKRRKTITY